MEKLHEQNGAVASEMIPIETALIEEFRRYEPEPAPKERNLASVVGCQLTTKQAKFLADIQVAVSVRLGELQMSAEQLIDLIPGNIFSFPIDTAAEVKLVVGEEEVARAHFVEVDGELLLELTAVKNDDGCSRE